MKRRAWAGAFVGVAAMVVTSVGSMASPAGAAPPPATGACVVTPADQVIDQVEWDLYNLINNYRLQNGRSWLPLHTDMTRDAAWFAQDMAAKNYFPPDHVDSNGRDIPTRMTWCGNTYNAWRENIAANTTTVNQAQTIFDQWKNSPTHNTNMLATDITVMGLAKAFNASSMYGYYYVNDFSDEKPLGTMDFNDDGKTDRSVFRPSTAQFFVNTGSPEVTQYGVATDIPVPGDYNGDGFTDKAVYRPSTGQWFIRNAPPLPEVISFGAACSSNCAMAGDVPVPADYDGDGDTDIAIYRPSTAQWFFRDTYGMPSIVQYGAGCGACSSPTDIPVPADYVGADGKAEIAVYRMTTGQWFVRGGSPEVVAYGAAGDRPVPADYNGDRMADIAVFRPSTGQWFRRGVSPEVIQYGAGGACCGDIPVPGDYNWDGSADIAVFRRSTGQWFTRGVSPEVTPYGNSTDIPLVLPYAIRVWVGLPQ